MGGIRNFIRSTRVVQRGTQLANSRNSHPTDTLRSEQHFDVVNKCFNNQDGKVEQFFTLVAATDFRTNAVDLVDRFVFTVNSEARRRLGQSRAVKR
jgi:hypothetical protein